MRRLAKGQLYAEFALASFAVLLTVAAANAQTAQSTAGQPQPAADWQTAAGGKMAFEVASIRPAEPDSRIRSNFALNFLDRSIPQGGRLSANLPLTFYIQFAYKMLLTSEQADSMIAHLPKWVATEKFVIEARADGNATTNELREMMKSLLADRFKLAAHYESREVPTLALVLVKPGRLGSRLRPHSDGSACDTKFVIPSDASSPSVPPGEFLPFCGGAQAIPGPNHTALLGARDVTIEYITSYLNLIQGFGRPILDRTGLSGTFDFSLYWVPEPNGPLSSLTGAQAEAEGSDLVTALKEQLGLKLQPEKISTKVLVIDHVERPSPN